MKNLTITLPDDVAAKLRVDAAKAGKSMSRYVADLLATPRPDTTSQIEAIERFLNGPTWSLTDANGRLPTRAEYEDEGIE